MAPMDAIWLLLAFVLHFVATHPPPPSPYKGASDIGHASEKLFKIVGNSASHSLNSW